MINPIAGIRPPLPVDLAGVTGATKPAGGGSSFQSAMARSIETVNGLQYSAQSTAMRFLQGEPIEVHQVALEQQQAAMAFDLFLEVRNKVVSAYQEVMRMPL
jgi:flagellar hook-basal body complex protein FliE